MGGEDGFLLLWGPVDRASSVGVPAAKGEESVAAGRRGVYAPDAAAVRA